MTVCPYSYRYAWTDREETNLKCDVYNEIYSDSSLMYAYV